MMRKGTFSQRLEWLDQVSRDADMRGLPTSIAIQLASRYINSTTGRAWPGQTLLATTLCANRRSVQRALDALVAAGHLSREPGGGRQSNTYRMRFRGGVETAPTQETRGGADVPNGRSTSTERGGLYAARIRGRNSGNNAGKAQTREDPVFSSGSRDEPTSPQPSAGQATECEAPHPSERNSAYTASSNKPPPRRPSLLPKGWVLGPAEFELAQRCAGWDPETAEEEFEHFCAHHKAKGTQSQDWLASWEVWCRNGYKLNQRSARGSPRVVVRGLQRWLARQGGSDE